MYDVLTTDDRGQASAKPRTAGPVTVVVIVYNDATRLGTAVTSALAQGEAVGEVVVVDDASTDGSGEVADRLAAANPRVRVVHRAANSGGCGTPRNDGMDAAHGEWVAFLDSDDVLPAGAVEALLTTARRHRADVVAGLCMRLELPANRRMPWQPELFATESVHDGLAGRPETVYDTLSVNKLYRREFLVERDLRFPDGAAHYEDFVFTGRVYGADPRFVVIPDTVYIWYARPSAVNPSISLRRDRIDNWRDRLAAHTGAVQALRASGHEGLAVAAQTKFLSYDLPMYLRDLHRRPVAYQEAWWQATRDHLDGFAPMAFGAAASADRWRTAVVRAREDVRTVSLARLAELSADPPRLAPPYAGSDTVPEWDEAAPAVPLDGMAEEDADLLPLCVTGQVSTGRHVTLRLELLEMYGRVAPAAPSEVDVELRHRTSGAVLRQRADLDCELPGRWQASVGFAPADLVESGRMTAWDVLATVHFATGGRSTRVKVRAAGGLRRRVTLRRGGKVVLEQPYATTDGSLAIRMAGGATGARQVMRARLAGLRRR